MLNTISDLKFLAILGASTMLIIGVLKIRKTVKDGPGHIQLNENAVKLHITSLMLLVLAEVLNCTLLRLAQKHENNILQNPRLQSEIYWSYFLVYLINLIS